MWREIPPVELPSRDPDSRPPGGFGWLLACGCIFNFFVFPVLRTMGGADGAIVLVGASAMGLFPAQLGALTLWLVWGPGPLLRRLALHWLAAIALYAAWALGIAIAFGADGPSGELPMIWGVVLCSLPLVSLAAQLPLWPLRTHLAWRVERREGEAPAEPQRSSSTTRQPLAIRDMLIGTVVTAIALAGIRVVAALTDAQQPGGQLDPRFWLAWGLAVLVTAVVSLLGFLPALCLLLRGSEPAPRMGLWLAYVALVTFVMLVVMASIFGGRSSPEPFFGLFCLLANFALAMAVPLLLARSHGWRLVLPNDAPSDDPRPLVPQEGAANKVAPLAATCETQPKEGGPA